MQYKHIDSNTYEVNIIQPPQHTLTHLQNWIQNMNHWVFIFDYSLQVEQQYKSLYTNFPESVTDSLRESDTNGVSLFLEKNGSLSFIRIHLGNFKNILDVNVPTEFVAQFNRYFIWLEVTQQIPTTTENVFCFS